MVNIHYSLSELNKPTSESFVEYASKRLKKLEKFFRDNQKVDVYVRVKKEGFSYVVNVEIKSPNHTFFSSEGHSNFRNAIDKVSDEIEQMIVKEKEKLQQR